MPRNHPNASTQAELASAKAMDAYNAGYRSVARGHTGAEARYQRYQVRFAAQFAAGRKAAEEAA